MGKQLISGDEAVPCKTQPSKPCSDCPFARTALSGWLGEMSADEWIRAIQGESLIDCHTLIGPQCAGASIFRANLCKRPRDKKQLILPPDEVLVFATVDEFLAHHGKEPIPQGWTKCEDCEGLYKIGAPHNMFCPARTCSECGITFHHILPVYDSRVLDSDGDPQRLCPECEEEYNDGEDEDEEE